MGVVGVRPRRGDAAGGWAAEAIRLADLGELRDDELAALHERANEARLRIGTSREALSDGQSMDRAAVELFEAVRAA